MEGKNLAVHQRVFQISQRQEEEIGQKKKGEHQREGSVTSGEEIVGEGINTQKKRVAEIEERREVIAGKNYKTYKKTGCQEGKGNFPFFQHEKDKKQRRKIQEGARKPSEKEI